jgi:peptidoglycan/LPS O-acetylase OafA/YrhL
LSFSRAETKQSYFPALDGLRGLSILLVVFGHAFLEYFNIRIAGYGVMIFFVLSGFLITNILLDGSESARTGRPLFEIIRNFYIRRALRIFPIYIATVTFLAAIGFSEFRQMFAWLMLYLTNFYIWHHDQWIGAASHLWSLAVEEQFYLIWPFVILLTPRRLLIPVSLLIVAVSWVSIYFFYRPGVPFYMMLPTSAGAYLAIGALESLLVDRWNLLRAEYWFRPMAVFGGLVIALRLIVMHSDWARDKIGSDLLIAIASPTAISMLAAWLILTLVANSNGLLSAIFVSRPMRYIGTISYGLYVVHLPVFFAAKSYVPGHEMLSAAVGTALSFALAAVSFRYFETPIRNYRVRFHYGSSDSNERQVERSGKAASQTGKTGHIEILLNKPVSP